ncbi:type II toxin-antitoxin system RelE/ParE family toxin [Duganella violaceipulchra]|uniref:Addiction module killer protein n=1 Tax=Duganella violaceipulchra TaxID=2849652 RepID=A0AA41HBN4_9BURK|nr:type II toxin-antitoxin system RelE/ParE family toxin [Duganella violaceicalia]MBV6321664.1 type II toxin-antitoxin system RelE/ParE family toxin [Duganella violaceicalia]MCP2008076.1 putative addiction module killer protein [Duganella violaceicalia]
MIEIIQSATFRQWVSNLRDRQAGALLAARLLRLARGITGDTRPIGDGVNELRLHLGPGYRVYYLHHGYAIIVLLCGGDKSSQGRDIRAAKRLARQWRLDHG